MLGHKSDCAVHNAPALPPGPCDCGLADHDRTVRRAALEAAAKAICYGCRQGWERESVPPREDGAFWHPEWREGCKADPIYRLMEKQP